MFSEDVRMFLAVLFVDARDAPRGIYNILFRVYHSGSDLSGNHH